jgi:hypothetical protein
MSYKQTIMNLYAAAWLSFFLSAASYADPSGWQVDVELKPLDETHSRDVINLVPKQSVLMKAYVWFPATETWIVNYPDWDMPGASIEKLTTSVANLDREWNGVQQYGHTQNYILTPVDIGTIKLTQSYVDVSALKDGSALVPISNPVQLNVELPEGIYSLDNFLPAYSIDVEQEYFLYTQSQQAQLIEENQLASLTLEQGQMLERRVTLFAKGIKGSSIPALLNKSSVNAQIETSYKDVIGIFGFEGGQRIDSLFYSPDQGGEVVLEGVDIEWWDLNDKQSRSISIAGASFDTVKVDAFEEAIALSWWEKNQNKIMKWLFIALFIGGTGLAVVLTFRTLIKRGYSLAKHRFNQFRSSEGVLLLKLAFALLFGRKIQAKRGLVRWQFSGEQRPVPQAITDYLYPGTQNSGSTAGQWKAFVSCCKLLPFRLSNVRVNRKAYGLPDL